jgi:hypothetical protein
MRIPKAINPISLPLPRKSRNKRPLACLSGLLPRCYQDRTNQTHLAPPRLYLDLLFLVDLDWQSWYLRQFLNRGSEAQDVTKTSGEWTRGRPTQDAPVPPGRSISSRPLTSQGFRIQRSNPAGGPVLS